MSSNVLTAVPEIKFIVRLREPHAEAFSPTTMAKSKFQLTSQHLLHMFSRFNQEGVMASFVNEYLNAFASSQEEDTILGGHVKHKPLATMIEEYSKLERGKSEWMLEAKELLNKKNQSHVGNSFEVLKVGTSQGRLWEPRTSSCPLRILMSRQEQGDFQLRKGVLTEKGLLCIHEYYLREFKDRKHHIRILVQSVGCRRTKNQAACTVRGHENGKELCGDLAQYKPIEIMYCEYQHGSFLYTLQVENNGRENERKNELIMNLRRKAKVRMKQKEKGTYTDLFPPIAE